jgi:hypothetical protein
MAARTRRGAGHLGWDKGVRERIQTSMLLNRLSEHALGNVEMSATAVRAAEILLSKALPSLSSVEHSGEIAQPTVARLPAVSQDVNEWQKQHVPQQTPPSTTLQ